MTSNQQSLFAWEPKNNAEAAFAVVRYIQEVIEKHLKHFTELFPFQKSFKAEVHLGTDCLIVKLEAAGSTSIPNIGDLDQQTIDQFKLIGSDPILFSDLQNSFGSDVLAFDKLICGSRKVDAKASWQQICHQSIDWLDTIVMPEVERLNKLRIAAAIPPQPSFKFSDFKDAIWILEDETETRQGTAFYLETIGLITCHHVLGENTKAFKPTNYNQKYAVRVIHENKDIDLAILEIDCKDMGKSLTRGTADKMERMAHLAVVGLPNYRVGDEGIISPGLVVGFRTKSGIRRILTNAPIVAGCSGGPVFDANSKVIGIAVTGADNFNKVADTEDHGIIPIDALDLIKSK